MTGTAFSLTWEQDSDPTPTASLPNQTFIGNVTGTYSAGLVYGSYPTSDFYPRFYTTSGGGGLLFDAYENGNRTGNEVFLFFGSIQLFTGATAAPHFAPGTWLGDSRTNIIYGTDLNNRYNITDATLTAQDTGVPEPRLGAITGLVLLAIAMKRTNLAPKRAR